MSDETITFRLGLHSLDSATASFRFKSVEQHLIVNMDPDRFVSMGRPGWIEVAITPITGGQR